MGSIQGSDLAPGTFFFLVELLAHKREPTCLRAGS
jgi:hypothetical protein